jgi:hypothetical protein
MQKYNGLREKTILRNEVAYKIIKRSLFGRKEGCIKMAKACEKWFSHAFMIKKSK